MNIVNIQRTYQQSIIDIWTKYASLPELNAECCEYRKIPVVPTQIKQDCLLFIGINPSHGNGGVPADKREAGVDFYTLNTQSDNPIPYFKKFIEIAKYCNTDWDHLDLLFIRETNQKIIEKLTYDRSDDRPNGLNFIQEQLNISFEILEKAQPKVIVASNAYVSEFFGKKKSKHAVFDKIWRAYDFDFEKDFDSELGTYTIPLNGRKVPIFFSGMLSGQRALDLGSLERLMWQLKWVGKLQD